MVDYQKYLKLVYGMKNIFYNLDGFSQKKVH